MFCLRPASRSFWYIMAIMVPLVVLGISVAGGWADRPFDKDPPGATPDDQLTDKERDALYQEIMDKEAREQELFAADVFPTLGLDWHALPRRNFLAIYAPSYNTLDEAVSGAEVVVHVRIKSVRFDKSPPTEEPNPAPSATTEASVIEYWKGDGTRSLTFQQDGTVVRHEDGSVSLLEAEPAPMLVPGDEAVLILERDGPAEPLRVVIGVGWYRVTNGSVNVPDIPFGDTRSRDNISVDELKSRVLAALAVAP